MYCFSTEILYCDRIICQMSCHPASYITLDLHHFKKKLIILLIVCMTSFSVYWHVKQKTPNYFGIPCMLSDWNQLPLHIVMTEVVRDSCRPTTLYIFARAVERQSAIYTEHSWFASPALGRHISTFRGYRILLTIRNPYINRFTNNFSIHS